MKFGKHLNWLEISRSALEKNIAALKRLAGKRILSASVKANAYGHGIPEVVSVLIDLPELQYLTVHSLEEAVASRETGWDREIMILGPVLLEELEAVFKYNLEPVVFTKETLSQLGKLSEKYGKKVRTHLKLETGTGRQGVTEKELSDIADLYKRYPNLKRPYGVSTHFANIEDTTSHEYAQFQLDNFGRMVKLLEKLGIKPEIRHSASSAALILFEKTRFELVRPGISVYGHWPSKETYLTYRLLGGENDLFQPVLSWKSRVTQIKQLPADSYIGYGCTYRTTAPTRLAVLPVGYFDGYDRKLSNKAYVLIKGRRAPVRGRICMNLMMVDITDIRGIKLEDEVTLLGRDGDEVITAELLADWIGTINYEVLSRISQAMPRQIIP